MLEAFDGNMSIPMRFRPNYYRSNMGVDCRSWRRFAASGHTERKMLLQVSLQAGCPRQGLHGIIHRVFLQDSVSAEVSRKGAGSLDLCPHFHVQKTGICRHDQYR